MTGILVLILVLVALIIGCNGYNRLMNGYEAVPEKPASAITKEIIITGELTNTNSVDISSGTVTYVEVMGYHATKYKEVVPYDPSLKNTTTPYYQTDGKVILFFHVGQCSYRIYIKP